MNKSFICCILAFTIFSECNDTHSPANPGQTDNEIRLGTFLLDYTIKYSSDGSFSGYTDYKYNENGYLSESIVYREDSTVAWHHQYEYNSKGLMIKDIKIKDPDPLLNSDTAIGKTSTVYLYNNAGKLIKRIHYDDSGQMSSYDLYEYNQFGLKVNYISYSKDSISEYRCTWQYDSRDSVIGTVQYNADSTIDQFDTYKYNKWGVQSYCLYSSDSTIQASAEMGYDSLGRMVTERVSARNIVHNYRFEYDTNGNMTSTSFCNYQDSCVLKKLISILCIMANP
jgi:hypothetical protein